MRLGWDVKLYYTIPLRLGPTWLTLEPNISLKLVATKILTSAVFKVPQNTQWGAGSGVETNTLLNKFKIVIPLRDSYDFSSTCKSIGRSRIWTGFVKGSGTVVPNGVQEHSPVAGVR